MPDTTGRLEYLEELLAFAKKHGHLHPPLSLGDVEFLIREVKELRYYKERLWRAVERLPQSFQDDVVDEMARSKCEEIGGDREGASG